AITRINTDSIGREAINGDSTNAQFSSDGSKVVFTSTATNLVAGDTNGFNDIFVKDLVTGALTRVSTNAAGFEGLSASDRVAEFSNDGTKVIFHSDSSNLVNGDTNAMRDIFVKTIASNARIVDNPNLTTQSVKGTFSFTDNDAGDTHAVSIDSDAHYGALAFNVTEPGIGGAGKVSYTYTVDNAQIHNLALDAVAHDTFHVTLSDGHGGTVTQDLTFDLLHPTSMIA
ncbi:MAG: hypothetical protein EBU85_08195, partial [Actinobacteria bacterium]|nr:hypothetical protein [Actinomycetota bacterium]